MPKMPKDWDIDIVADEAELKAKLNLLRELEKDIKYVMYNSTDDTFVIAYLEDRCPKGKVWDGFSCVPPEDLPVSTL